MTEVHDRHGPALFGLALRLGLSVDEAREAVQETLLRLWAELCADRTIERADAWAFRVLYRLAIDGRRRRASASATLDRLARQGATSTEPALAIDALAVWAEVDRLPERQRLVLYLRYRADLAFESIAEILDISASGARSQATTALATLRRRLSEPGDAP